VNTTRQAEGEPASADAASDESLLPRPREHELPSGDLAVSSHWVHGVRDATVVPAEDRPLYRLLLDLLWTEKVPDTMPARLATACEDLVDVWESLVSQQGSASVGGVQWGLSYCKLVRDVISDHRDRDTLPLVAVGCSGSKFDDPEPLPAKRRYKGAYWTNKREYGETCAADWRIISAEHAVLDPETPIEDYDCTPDRLRGVPVDSADCLPSGDPVTTLLDQWARDVLEGLLMWLSEQTAGVDPRDIELQILLGRGYREPLEERGVFEALEVDGDLSLSFPFQEEPQAQGGMLQQIDWMGDAVDAAKEAEADDQRPGGERE